MRKLFSTFFIVAIYTAIAFGQIAQIDIPITVVNGPNTRPLKVGLDETATTGIDLSLGESAAPPFGPAGTFDAKWDLSPYGVNFQVYKDYRNAPSFPYSGTVEHKLLFQLATGATTIALDYELPSGATMVVKDPIGGVVFNSGTLSGTGSYTVPQTAFGGAIVTMTYTNISPSAPGPLFGVSPSSLSFGSVYTGQSANLPVTISNAGNANALTITNIVSSDPQFTFAPNTFPINVPALGSAVVTVTFAPTALGVQNGTLTFTHNAPGSPSVYNVSGTGADPAPVFNVNPSSLNFGNVNTTTPLTLPVTVNNTGALPLNITSVVGAPSVYTVSPSSATIAAGGSQVFNVTFAPTTSGLVAGTLTFTHNAAGSPSVVNLSGTGITVSGLIFEKEVVFNKEDSSYTENIQLLNLSAKAQAIQFRLLVNKAAGDNVFLTFQNITKGADVAGSNWVLQYNVFRGPITANGASVDSIYVLLYDLNQNGGLPAGDYSNLLNFKYRVADLPALLDSAKSTFRITNAEASTYQGFPINITPSRNELVVWAKNRVSQYGDVNGDGVLDILDLIDVVDHILGRDSLTGAAFTRADIAPWTVGNAAPNPDGFVNVMDLALIQNIILTGVYPDGTTLNQRPEVISGNENGTLSKTNGEADAKLKLFITKDGITVRIDSKYDIRGIQLEMNKVHNDPGSMTIDTKLGEGYYLRVNELLRVLLYDRLAEKTIEKGFDKYVATLPFAINKPEDITIEKLIIVNTDKQKLTKIVVEIEYAEPGVVLDYVLFQNYPNPFNPNTSVKFQVPQDGLVTIKIFDMLGQEVGTLFSDMAQRGTYTLNWDGKDKNGNYVSSGTYMYRMTAGDFIQTKKMMFVK